MEAIKHDENEIILKAFHKFLELVKNPEEYERSTGEISEHTEAYNYLNYTNALFFLSEFYDILPKDVEWEDIIHKYMIGIKSGIEKGNGHVPPSLFGGLSEIGYSIFNVYKKTGSYKKFLITLNKHIVAQVNLLLDKYEKEIGNMEMTAYDSIYGFAGQGSYLLMFKEDEEVKRTLERICRLFINMTKEIEVNGHKVPGWYIPMERLSTDLDKDTYKDGNFNLSLSHGISGPLTFMALALREGIEVEGQKEGMKRILDTLLKFSFKDEKGNVYWSGRLSLKEYLNGESDVKKANRQSWCYGSVGIGRAMYVAGIALEDKEVIKFSTHTMEGIAEMSVEEWGLNCGHICHGHAGVLAIMEAMYKDTKNVKYKLGIDKAVKVITEGFEPNSLFGFYNYTVKDKKKDNYHFEYLDDYSFLEGSTGTILTLMASSYPDKISWMRHLVID